MDLRHSPSCKSRRLPALSANSLARAIHVHAARTHPECQASAGPGTRFRCADRSSASQPARSCGMLKVSGMSLGEVARATASGVGSVKLKAHRAYEKMGAVLQAVGSTLRSGDDVV